MATSKVTGSGRVLGWNIVTSGRSTFTQREATSFRDEYLYSEEHLHLKEEHLLSRRNIVTSRRNNFIQRGAPLPQGGIPLFRNSIFTQKEHLHSVRSIFTQEERFQGRP